MKLKEARFGKRAEKALDVHIPLKSVVPAAVDEGVGLSLQNALPLRGVLQEALPCGKNTIRQHAVVLARPTGEHVLPIGDIAVKRLRQDGDALRFFKHRAGKHLILEQRHIFREAALPHRLAGKALDPGIAEQIPLGQRRQQSGPLLIGRRYFGCGDPARPIHAAAAEEKGIRSVVLEPPVQQLQIPRHEIIVAVHKAKVSPTCSLQALVSCRGGAPVLLTQQLKTGILFRVSRADRITVIPRSIVDQDHFIIIEGLRADGRQTSLQRPLRVVDRNKD